MKPIQIACVIPIANDPTSFYRGVGPLSYLKKRYPDKVTFTFPQQSDWSQLKLADLVFMQRPAAPEHFVGLCVAKDLGLKVWIDFDDDNLAVPKDNPMYGYYQQMPVKEAIIKLARHCDVLTVSTEFLKKKYGIYNKNTVVIPNAVDDSLLHLRQIPPGPRQKRILWRGTQSHTRNLMTVAREIVSLSRKHSDWRFTFFGMDPIDLTDHMKNAEVHGQVTPLEFFKVMCSLNAGILYYPLGPTDHAQARSHISWLEGTFAGCVVVASKNEEFTRPGLLNFSTPPEFEDVIDRVIAGHYDCPKLVEESWNEIQSKYMLSHTNKARMQVIESLLSSPA